MARFRIFAAMEKDLKQLLQEWPYEADSNLRLMGGDDGRSYLQVRLPMGIEQYELDARPDGMKVRGYDSALSMVLAALDDYKLANGSEYGFAISAEDFTYLQQEAVMFYSRYILLFQINDFSRVERDTEHNLKICDFLEKYCQIDDQKNMVLQFRPYILRMHAVSRALSLSQESRILDAITVLDNAIATIESLVHVPGPAFEFEKARSVNHLQNTRKHLLKQEAEPIMAMQQELSNAIEAEDYERAAMLRDRLRVLGHQA